MILGRKREEITVEKDSCIMKISVIHASQIRSIRVGWERNMRLERRKVHAEFWVVNLTQRGHLVHKV
jgi:hypothetical protein